MKEIAILESSLSERMNEIVQERLSVSEERHRLEKVADEVRLTVFFFLDHVV